MERRSTFAATTVGKSFWPRLPAINRRVSLDAAADTNEANEGVISAAATPVGVYLIHTDEEP
jgi:acetate kinase